MNKTIHTILALETSCDETSAAVVRAGRCVLSSVIASQAQLHRLYGGVVPEIASRMHVEALVPVYEQALQRGGVTMGDIDAVAVTNGPGLAGALLTGLSFAKALAYAAGKPLVCVHHIDAHISACYLGNEALTPPFLALVVSGGHTLLVHAQAYGRYTVLGTTVDDAAGEAFDKTARVIGLGYPGGVELDRLAEQGDPARYAFPRALMREDTLDFSFSGLKTAVMQQVQREGCANRADLAASLREAIVDVLVHKTQAAMHASQMDTLAVCGGVAANSALRARMRALCERRGWRLFIPELPYCTDNAAMVGAAAYYQAQRGEFADLSVNAYPSLPL